MCYIEKMSGPYLEISSYHLVELSVSSEILVLFLIKILEDLDVGILQELQRMSLEYRRQLWQLTIKMLVYVLGEWLKDF